MTSKFDIGHKAAISIITVVRSDREGLVKTIASIRAQTFVDFEFIVIDGQSTDGTIDVIEDNADIIDYWQSEADDGIYDAMNKGLKRANGRFVLFLNAADRLLDRFSLQRALNQARSHANADVVYFDAVGEQGQAVSRFNSLSSIGFDSVGNHQATLVRTGLHQRHLFDTRYRIKGDRDVQLRLARAGHVAQTVPLTIVCCQAGGVSSTRIGAKEWENMLISWRNRVGIRLMLFAACLAMLRISVHQVVRMSGLDWDSTKRFLLRSRPTRRRPVGENAKRQPDFDNSTSQCICE